VSSREIEIEDLLPLPEATFHILMAVAEDDRHGYAIIQEVATRTDGMLKLSPGTLYPSIRRMLEQGLIQETAERPVPELAVCAQNPDTFPRHIPRGKNSDTRAAAVGTSRSPRHEATLASQP
jgi:hypothetical protein